MSSSSLSSLTGPMPASVISPASSPLSSRKAFSAQKLSSSSTSSLDRILPLSTSSSTSSLSSPHPSHHLHQQQQQQQQQHPLRGSLTSSPNSPLFASPRSKRHTLHYAHGSPSLLALAATLHSAAASPTAGDTAFSPSVFFTANPLASTASSASMASIASIASGGAPASSSPPSAGSKLPMRMLKLSRSSLINLTAIRSGSGLNRSDNINSELDAAGKRPASPAPASPAPALDGPAACDPDIANLVVATPPTTKLKVSPTNAAAYKKTMRMWTQAAPDEEWDVSEPPSPSGAKRERRLKDTALDAAVRRAQFQSSRRSSKQSLNKTSVEDLAHAALDSSNQSSFESQDGDFIDTAASRNYQTAVSILKPSSAAVQRKLISGGGSRTSITGSFDTPISREKPSDTPPHAQPLNVRKIADFKILGILGGGAFSSVYLGVHKATQRQVAIKLLADIRKTKAGRRSFCHELYVNHRCLPHPNIVAMVEPHCRSHNGDVALFFELCTHGDVFERLLSGTIEVDQMERYFTHLMLAVNHLHSLQIAHMDIKPENMFLTADDSVKLGDFGLSVCMDDGATYGIRGSSCYIAPEVLASSSASLFREVFGDEASFEVTHVSDEDGSEDGGGQEFATPPSVPSPNQQQQYSSSLPRAVQRSLPNSPAAGKSSPSSPLSPSSSEQITYNAAKADLWSCGIVLFLLVVQCMPWTRAHPRCLPFSRFLDGSYRNEEPWRLFPQRLMRLFDMMLVLDPQQRASASDVLAYLADNSGLFAELDEEHFVDGDSNPSTPSRAGSTESNASRRGCDSRDSNTVLSPKSPVHDFDYYICQHFAQLDADEESQTRGAAGFEMSASPWKSLGSLTSLSSLNEKS